MGSQAFALRNELYPNYRQPLNTEQQQLSTSQVFPKSVFIADAFLFLFFLLVSLISVNHKTISLCETSLAEFA